MINISLNETKWPDNQSLLGSWRDLLFWWPCRQSQQGIIYCYSIKTCQAIISHFQRAPLSSSGFGFASSFDWNPLNTSPFHKVNTYNALQTTTNNIFIYLYNSFFTLHPQTFHSYNATQHYGGRKPSSARRKTTTIRTLLQTFPLTSREEASRSWLEIIANQVGQSNVIPTILVAK